MKIIQEHNKCIGCGTCAAVCPKYWEIGDDGKAKPIGAKKEGSNYQLEVKDAGCNQEAADSCPVKCIKLEK